jgi:hypothetical protein
VSGSAPSSVRKPVFPAGGPSKTRTAACESDSTMKKRETSDGPMEAVLVHLAARAKDISHHISSAMVEARYNERLQVGI